MKLFASGYRSNSRNDKYRICIFLWRNGHGKCHFHPSQQKLQLQFNEGSTLITETDVALEAEKEYTFTYIQEGSVGIFYLDGEAALTVRVYGVSGKPVRLYAESNTVSFTGLREYTR